MAAKPTYYELLELPRDATPEEIRRAYHEAARKLHPDVNLDRSATERFIQIQAAYEILSEPKRREIYDKKLAEESQEPITVELTYSRPNVTIIDEPQLVYILLDFSAVERFASKYRPPLNICLVLDRSTSMQGVRMDTIKTAAIELVRQLKAEDILSIVAFSDRSDVLVPAAKQQDRVGVENQIQMLRAGGGTEIFQGLQAGFREVTRNQAKSLINHIILLTDGRTYGDEVDCLQLANEAASSGIRITGLGIGTEWNDQFLDELTGRTGGSSFYISKANDIRSFLQEKFRNLNDIFAEHVALNLTFPSYVQMTSLFRMQPEPAILPAVPPLRLGSVPKSSKLSILLEMVISPFSQDETRVTLANGDVTLVLPLDPSKIHRIPIQLSRLSHSEIGADPPPKPIIQALSQINMYRMQEKARSEVQEGKVQEASVRLQRLATQLLSIGEKELAQTAMMEAERIQQTHMLSPEGEKRMKYGTRAFLLPARVGGG